MTRALVEPDTEPIRTQPAVEPPASPAARWARAHGIYLGIGVLAALASAMTPLPRFESILTGIAGCNTALWVLRKIGGR